MHEEDFVVDMLFTIIPSTLTELHIEMNALSAGTVHVLVHAIEHIENLQEFILKLIWDHTNVTSFTETLVALCKHRSVRYIQLYGVRIFDELGVVEAIKSALTKPRPVHYFVVRHGIMGPFSEKVLNAVMANDEHVRNFNILYFKVSESIYGSADRMEMICVRNRTILTIVARHLLAGVAPKTTEERFMHELMIDHPFLVTFLYRYTPVRLEKYVRGLMSHSRSLKRNNLDLLERAIGASLPPTLTEDCWRIVKEYISITQGDILLPPSVAHNLIAGMHHDYRATTSPLPLGNVIEKLMPSLPSPPQKRHQSC